MKKLLIIEDDPKLSQLLKSEFELENYRVRCETDGSDGLDAVRRWKPNLVILDVMLPTISGYDVCRTLRKEKNDVPILMLTAKGSETEKVVGLDMGADDYLSKPFGELELLARVKALLRRHDRFLDRLEQMAFDDIEVNFKERRLTKAGKQVLLTPKEFQILELLLRRRGEAVSREEFLAEIWNYEEMPSTRTVDTQIMTLRQKLSLDGQDAEHFIATVFGIGYRFIR